MNRYQLQQNLEGVRENLAAENKKLGEMIVDSKSTITDREEQSRIVKDLENREKMIADQLKALDEEAAANLKAQNANKQTKALNEKEKIINAKAELIRATMMNQTPSKSVFNALGDDTTSGGKKILPTTLTTELVTAPFAKNPLRQLSTFTNIMNLEVPKISFTLDDDDFLATDSATAKELAASADTIQFGRNKFKVFADITETVLRGTETNLVETVERALRAGMAKKEKKIALAPAASATTASFYHQTTVGSTSTYDITCIEKTTMFKAIKAALADLEDDYADNASILMKKSDYYDMIEDLANGSSTLYQAQPEQILGAPVIFCDLATIPVIGDFNYSHFNYDLDITYESDKNVKTGVTSFVLTGYMDHKIKMLSAFRLAVVGE